MKLKFAKISPDAQMPRRANPDDAGADLYYAGEDCFINPSESKVLSTGIVVEIPKGYAMIIKNRSSVASKQALLVGAEVCDAGYAGEIFVNLINVGEGARAISKGDRIAQAVLVPVSTPELIEVAREELYKDAEIDSNRGAGGFGSTGK
jgi:dUTP pyrophosphatase